MIDQRHELVKLAALIDWEVFEREWSGSLAPNPAIPGFGVTAAIRLPVAPRPFRDELLSSWMERVAGRYGLAVPGLTAYLVGQGGSTADLWKIDDISPDRGLLRLWARGSRIASARLERLSLKSRYPERPQDWFFKGARGIVPSCLACFDADLAAGRDAYIRAK